MQRRPAACGHAREVTFLARCHRARSLTPSLAFSRPRRRTLPTPRGRSHDLCGHVPHSMLGYFPAFFLLNAAAVYVLVRVRHFAERCPLYVMWCMSSALCIVDCVVRCASSACVDRRCRRVAVNREGATKLGCACALGRTECGRAARKLEVTSVRPMF